MGVEQDGLDLGEQRVVAVHVGPARLHHRQGGIGEVRHGAPQEVGRGQEVGVEDGDELAAGLPQALGQRTRLVAGPVSATEVADGQAPSGVALHRGAGDLDGVVGRIVEHLDFQPLVRVVNLSHRVDQALDHVLLVVDR